MAFAVGGDPGARLLHHLGVPVCGDTVLAQLHAAARSPTVSAPAPAPRILSVDDFAFRRGRTYGSMLVDLERHEVVDLLPDRSGDRFAAWLVSHPGVQVISRDRSSEYAHAAQRVAPQAIQVADRFHLLHNLREVVFRVCKRHARLVRQGARPGAAGAAEGRPPSLTHLRLDRELSREQARVEMADRFHAVQQLARQGLNQAVIARTLGLNWQTVHKYLTYTTPPQRSSTIRQRSALTPYQNYLLRRWGSGCHNARQVWREMVAQGYPGSYRTVARLTGYLRRQEHLGATAPLAPVGMTAGQAAGLVLVRPEQRTPSEAVALEQLGSLHPHLHRVLTLFATFAALLRNPPGDPGAAQHLAEWMDQARSSGVPELKAFATKLGQDREAVAAALALPYSQGQIEGFITKLKLLKRSMYGRAQFAVLRERVLYTAR
jgi:transposase